jgi:LysM repeat protein
VLISPALQTRCITGGSTPSEVQKDVIETSTFGGESEMAQLSDHQIAALVVEAGFVGDQQETAFGIVLAESGGRPDAVGDVSLQNATFGPSIGLFQIRSLRSEKGTGGVRDELANVDPATNARHAHVVFSQSGSFRPWSTFTNGAFKRFLDRARAALGGSPAAVIPASGVHIVHSGETLSGIAAAHGLTLAQLRALNPGLFDAAHHNGSLINPGEQVLLSAPAPAQPATPVTVALPGGHTHVVAPGETLSSIAKANGVTLAQLRELNPGLFDAAHHHGDLIHPGELVKL